MQNIKGKIFKEFKNYSFMGNKTESEEFDSDLQKKFEEEIKKPYYRVNYFDDFKLPYDRLDVSAIIPTYNRCPYNPKTLKRELNSLAWAIQSLILQKPPIKEIVIVDDKSEDYTKQVVESFREEAEEKGIKIHYIKNKIRVGNVSAITIGAKLVNSKYLFLTDDDCIIAPYSAFGGVYTFELLEQKGIKIGAVNLPTYARTSVPEKAVSKKDIGVISFIKGEHKSNKNAFPTEYLGQSEKGEKFLNEELQILNPFSIQNLNTNMIISKKAFEEVGGYKRSILERGCDREFGATLLENGYLIYFQPDPKFHSVHGSYGLETKKAFFGDDWFRKRGGMISLKKAMSECDKPNLQSGMRVSPEDYLYNHIISFFYLVYPRNKQAAINWIKKVYTTFVKENNPSLIVNSPIKISSESEREKIWRKAINTSLGYIRKKEKEETKKITNILKQLKEKGEETKDIFTILEKL